MEQNHETGESPNGEARPLAAKNFAPARGLDATGSNRLPILAGEIEAAHQAAYGAARTALEHAARCGRLLIEARAAVGHGGWLPWLEQNTTVSARQCQKYMRLAKGWSEIEGKCAPGSHLTLTGAVALLAEPEDEKPADKSREKKLRGRKLELEAEVAFLNYLEVAGVEKARALADEMLECARYGHRALALPVEGDA